MFFSTNAKIAALFLVLFVFYGCAGVQWGRRPQAMEQVDVAATESPELNAFREAVAEFDANTEERLAHITHPRHQPRLYSHGQPTEYVVVLMHGLYESPDYLKGLANNFYRRGYNVLLPLLSKHWSQPLEKLDDVNYREWIRDLEFNLSLAKRLGKKIILAGHSTGGLLAVYGALEYPERVVGLLLWSPALQVTAKVYLGTSLGTATQHFKKLEYNKIAKKPPADGVLVSYYSAPAGRQVNHLSRHLEQLYRLRQPVGNSDDPANPFMRPQMYAQLQVPLFIVSPGYDEIVSKSEMQSLYKEVRAPKDFYELSEEDHSSTPKAEGDAVKGVQEVNKSFAAMVDRMNDFLDKNFR